MPWHTLQPLQRAVQAKTVPPLAHGMHAREISIDVRVEEKLSGETPLPNVR